MHITIINDCRDNNAASRQIARTASIFNTSVNIVGVRTDLEAAGNLIDTIDAMEEASGIILVNVAPRSKEAWWLNTTQKQNNKNYQDQNKNGTAFAYFYYKNILIISTISGLTLSLVKKLKLTTEINVIDIPKTLEKIVKAKLISQTLATQIANSQFRSFDFVPRAAKWITDNPKLISSRKAKINAIPDAPKSIWWIDNFGNCKTTLLKVDIKIKNKAVKTKKGEISFIPRLADVGEGKAAMIQGSSGINNKRFLEIIVQGGNAAKILKLYPGDNIM